MVPLIGAMLIGASVGLHFEEVGPVPPALSAAISQRLAAAIGARSRLTVVLDESREGCLTDGACVAAIRSRTASVDLLLVRLIAGPSRVRIVAERLGAAQAVGAETRGEVDLDKSGRDLEPAIVRLIEPLFAPPPAGPALDGVAVSPEAAGPGFDAWAAGLIGGGVALLAAGVAFGVSSDGARGQLAGASSQLELSDLDQRAHQHALVANLLFTAAAGALVAGVAAWIAD